MSSCSSDPISDDEVMHGRNGGNEVMHGRNGGNRNSPERDTGSEGSDTGGEEDVECDIGVDDHDDGEDDDDDDDSDDSDDDTVSNMATALQPYNAPALQPYLSGQSTSIIQKAKTCTVFNGSHVVNNIKQVSPNTHRYFTREGNEFIKSQTKRLRKLYVGSAGTNECMEIMQSENALVIVGNPGEGKTTAGIMTANAFMKRGFQIVRITSPQEWNSKVVQADEAEKMVIFVDDIFGTFGVDEHKVNEWLSMSEVITNHLVRQQDNVKMICVMRRKIYKATKQRLKRFKWYKTFRVVDLSDERYAMTQEEKQVLLNKYFNYYHIDMESRCTKAAQITTPHGFPHCVEIYCTELNCTRMGISFFLSPLPAIEREIQILYETESTEYFALMLINLAPSQTVNVELCSDDEEFEFDKQLLNRARLLSKIPITDGMNIVRAIENLVGIFLREEDDGSVRFKHDTLSEMICVIATRNSPVPAITYLDIRFLAEKTKYLTYRKEDRESFAILPKKTKRPLVVRLTEALFNGQAFAASKHHAWDDPDFVQEWMEYNRKKESASSTDCTQLDDLLAAPIETYCIMKRTSCSGSHNAEVGLLFLFYLNKKDFAIRSILKAYDKAILAESEILLKFKREVRCPSGRKLRRSSMQGDESDTSDGN